MKNIVRMATLLITALFVFSGCSSMNMGSKSAKTTATGYAGGANSGDNSIEKCAQPLGTLALLEETETSWYQEMSSNGVKSTTPILRLLAQQSNCFVIVERGRGFSAMERERAIRDSGELRESSNFTKGQMVAADFTLTPTIIYNNNDAGKIGGMGMVGALVGMVAKSKEAQAMLSVVENRSGVQIAIAEGSAKSRDIGGLFGMFTGSGAGILGGYAKTAEGKVIVASLTDAFNNIVKAVKNYKAQESSGPNGHGSGGRLQIN